MRRVTSTTIWFSSVLWGHEIGCQRCFLLCRYLRFISTWYDGFVDYGYSIFFSSLSFFVVVVVFFHWATQKKMTLWQFDVKGWAHWKIWVLHEQHFYGVKDTKCVVCPFTFTDPQKKKKIEKKINNKNKKYENKKKTKVKKIQSEILSGS